MTGGPSELPASPLLAQYPGQENPTFESLDDPITDTSMIVSLAQLRPYDLDPRVTRNPRYDEIKESIRHRGLDAPPAITRRPGEAHFRIRNGGNTRLSILRELWSETKDEKFFHVACLFRPWPQRGEIVALTGHLAENDLRGGLTFIERALGVEKARELYELECGHTLSQSELSRRLVADGLPIHQSHISRMRDAVQYLLPAIPNVLYSGLGRHQVERLAVMRRSGERVWQEHAKGKGLNIEFAMLFQDALMMFDGEATTFSLARVQDELIGQMTQWLGIDYDKLTLELEAGERRQRVLGEEPAHDVPKQSPCPTLCPPQRPNPISPKAARVDDRPADSIQDVEPSVSNVIDRLQSIQRLVAEHTGDELQPNSDRLPPSQGSLFPISDIWNIEPGLDAPERLRIHISQFAREIAQDTAQADLITPVDEGIGFRCDIGPVQPNQPPSTLLTLLETLTASTPQAHAPIPIGPLLLGCPESSDKTNRLSDASLVKLFRLIRLARRLIDLKSDDQPTNVTR
ncbi:ParB family protein [Pseudomonas brassicacearum]|uniref:ParB family protein n=1 Tax=Pseudomonas brassicacearum TaxID=930166 RepID=UPI00346542EC